MAKDAQLIFGGSGDVTLYDATNGYFNLGYLSDIEFTRRPNKIAINRLMIIDLHSTYTFKATALQSDDDMFSALDARRNSLQTIYIVGAGRLFTLPAQLINYESLAPFRDGEAHTILIEGKSASDFTQEINLLGSYGGFEVDTNSDGVADGWTNINLDTVSMDGAFLNESGGLYCQDIVAASTPCSLQLTDIKICPFWGPTRVTFSAYLFALNSIQDFFFRIHTYNTSDVLITTYTSSGIQMNAYDKKLYRYSIWINESVLVKGLKCDFYFNGPYQPHVQIDNAVLSLENRARHPDNDQYGDIEDDSGGMNLNNLRGYTED